MHISNFKKMKKTDNIYKNDNRYQLTETSVSESWDVREVKSGVTPSYCFKDFLGHDRERCAQSLET